MLKEKGRKLKEVSGLVVLSGTTSWISKAIMWMTNSRFSHASILLGRLYGHIFKFEAQRRGVIAFPFKPGKYTYCELWRITATDKDIQEAMDKIIPFSGQPYSYLSIAGFAITKPLSWIGIHVKNPFDNGFWCSKVAQYFVNQVVKKGLFNPNNTTPDDMGVIFMGGPVLFTKVAVSNYGSEGLEWL